MNVSEPVFQQPRKAPGAPDGPKDTARAIAPAAGTLPTPRGAAKVHAAAFLATVTGVALLANLVIGSQHFPNYATWTGIRPLEEKLGLLAGFSSAGSPDALILGSSIGDFGFSAEMFSQLVSDKRGSEYRVFNFSSGGTEVVTLPKLYQLARTITRPKELLLVLPAGIKRSNDFLKQSPDYIMGQAPIASGLTSPWLLPLDKAAWSLPLIHDAAAIRDLILFGRFANLPGQGSDLYPITSYGDTLSFNYQVSDTSFLGVRELIATQLQPLSLQQEREMSADQQLRHYFNDPDIAAMRELRQLTEADGVQVTVIAHTPASTLYPDAIENRDYYLARQQFFSLLTNELDAHLISVIEGFHVPQYAVNDSLHLNRYGARLFTARVTASYLQDPSILSAETEYLAGAFPRFESIPSADETINQFSSIVPTPNAPGLHTVRLQLVINHAVPKLPASNLFLALRTPDGKDLVAPAKRMSYGSVEATFPSFNSQQNVLLMARLLEEVGGRRVALNQPISGFAWVAP